MVIASAFTHLDAPAQDILVRQRHTANMLPTARGTYALYDRFGELLYIGKAANLRARVQSHLRAGDPESLFPDWRRSVSWIEARLAASEVEALLIEADLIGKLAPPLNRQMRSWSRYCYLVATDDAIAPLSISCQELPWQRCFGPYRTRRQALATCDAVFRTVQNNGQQNGRLERAYALLAGHDESLALEAEALVKPDTPRNRRTRLLAKQAETLRQAFDRARLLSAARQMLAAMIFIRSDRMPRQVAVITTNGLCIDTPGQSEHAAAAFLNRYRKRTSDVAIGSDRPLPKNIADLLCVAARQHEHLRCDFQYIPANEAATLSPPSALALTQPQS